MRGNNLLYISVEHKSVAIPDLGNHRPTRAHVRKQGGSLRVGTRVLVLPARQAGAVKTLAVDGAPAALAIAGDAADVSLTDGADTVRVVVSTDHDP